MSRIRRSAILGLAVLLGAATGGVAIQALAGVEAGATLPAATVTVTANPANLLPGGTTTATATVTPVSPGGPAPTGTVDFFAVSTATLAGDPTACITTPLEATATVMNGTATATLGADLGPGSYELFATYMNGNFATVKCTSSAPTPLSVSASILNTWTTTLSASATSVTTGGSISLDAHVVDGSGVPVTSGQVTLTDTNVGAKVQNNIGTVALNGTGDAVVTNLGGWTTPGIFTITATFEGSSATVPMVVTSGPPVNNSWTTSLTINPSSINSGETTTLDAQVVNTASGAPVTVGQVTFSDVNTTLGTAPLNLGTVSLDGTGNAVMGNVGGWSVGVHQITATYQGSSAVSQLSVTAPTSTGLVLAPAELVTGGSTQLTAAVTGVAPTGSVNFSVNGNAVGSAPLGPDNAAVLSYQAVLAPGAYPVVAVYSGDAVNQPSASSAQVLTVDPDATTTVANASPATSGFGSPVTLNGTVSPGTANSGTPGGLLTFLLDSSTGPVLCSASLTNGQASCSTSALPLGNSTVIASYGGDTNHTASSGSAPVVANPLATTTSLHGAAGPVLVGQPITYTATVSPTPDGGFVGFTDNGTTVSGCASVPVNTGNGTATCTTTSSATGNHTILATFGGSPDGEFSPSSSPPLTEVVTDQDTSRTVASVNPSTSIQGSAVTLSATVTPGGTTSGTPQGTVTFSLGNAAGTVLCAANLNAGTASCPTSTLPLGTDTVFAAYGGDGTHTGSSATAQATVTLSAPSVTCLDQGGSDDERTGAPTQPCESGLLSDPSPNSNRITAGGSTTTFSMTYGDESAIATGSHAPVAALYSGGQLVATYPVVVQPHISDGHLDGKTQILTFSVPTGTLAAGSYSLVLSAWDSDHEGALDQHQWTLSVPSATGTGSNSGEPGQLCLDKHSDDEHGTSCESGLLSEDGPNASHVVADGSTTTLSATYGDESTIGTGSHAPSVALYSGSQLVATYPVAVQPHISDGHVDAKTQILTFSVPSGSLPAGTYSVVLSAWDSDHAGALDQHQWQLTVPTKT